MGTDAMASSIQPRNELGYKLQQGHFLHLFVLDLDAKGFQMDAIINGEWTKTPSVSIADHRKRLVWLLYCLNFFFFTRESDATTLGKRKKGNGTLSRFRRIDRSSSP